MRNLPLYAAAATLAAAGPAYSSVLTLGGGYAESCYKAAEAQDARAASLEVCDRALNEEALMPRERMATFVNRGILHLRRTDLKSARADFDAASAIDPTEPEVWLNKAILTVRFGKSSAALPLVEKALAFNTKRPALAYFVRAMAQEDSGNIAAAYHDLQRAQQLEPKWQEPAIELTRFAVRQR